MVLAVLSFLLLLGSDQTSCKGEKVQFFELEDFKGDIILETESLTSCTDIDDNEVGFKILNGSVKTSGCIAMFNGIGCSNHGYVIKSELKAMREIHTADQQYYVASLRNCIELESRPQIDMDIAGISGLDQYWKNESESKAHFRNICTCANYVTENELTSVHGNAYGNCFKFYKSKNCMGVPILTLHQLEFSIKLQEGSVKPCQPSLFCSRLKTTVLKFEPLLSASNFKESGKEMSMNIKQSYINNGPATVQFKYEAKKEVTQMAEFSFSETLRGIAAQSREFEMSTTNISENKHEEGWDINGGITARYAVFAIGISGGYYNKSIQTLKHSLSSAFLSSSKGQLETGNNDKLKNTLQTKRTFTESQTIVVPPCTKYNVYSVVKMAEEVEVNYVVEFAIFGETISGRKLTAAEVLEILIWSQKHGKFPNQLTILNQHNKMNNFTVVAATTALLRANYGLSSDIIGGGEDIQECLNKQNQVMCD